MPDFPTPALTYRGKRPTSQMLVELWTNAEQRMRDRTDRIQKCQALRRFTERVKIDPGFLREHPEIDADRLVSLLPERESYERDLITKAGAVEPQISRRPLDVTDTAIDRAEEYESYMRDVAADEENGIPQQVFIEKGAEDGEYGIVSLPAHLDSDGVPDFYDRLTERAYAALKADAKANYRPDSTRKRRYVRVDDKGRRVRNPRYEIGPHPEATDEQDARPYKERKAEYDRKNEKSREKHAADVRRYLLQHAATNHRVIPALDCYPLLGRGHGKQKWSVEGLIERSLLEREELVERQLGWRMMGDRLLLPRGASWTHAGRNKQFYLYTAYLMLRAEDESGIQYHPCILYTVGGAATWWDGAAVPGGDDAEDAVAIIDLYDELSITKRKWHYEFGSHTSDDDPNWYGRPALWQFRNRILNVEELETAAHIQVVMEAYSGSWAKIDPKILEHDPEAHVEGDARTLRKPRKPRPGDIEPSIYDITPASGATLTRDHWQLQGAYTAALQQAMMIDDATQTSGSGAAMLVQGQQGQIAKRHIREAALRAFKFCLEADADIRLGAFKTYGVKWPILSSTEKAVGHEIRDRTTYKEFDPEWLGEDENLTLAVSYGEEFNLARAQMEMDAADRGYRALKHVAAAFGESDEMNLRVDIERDRQWKSPQNQLLLDTMVDDLRSMTRQRKVALLKAQQKMLAAEGLPGAMGGVPSSSLNRAMGDRAAPPSGGGGGPTIAAAQAGGVKAGAMNGARMALQAQQQAGQQVGAA
jgi:hypothetical protein